MIENEDTPTMPRPISPAEAIAFAISDQETTSPTQANEATTLQTVTPQSGVTTAVTLLPYLDVNDLLELHVVSDPQISPDGALIAFTMHCCHSEKNTTSSAIWLVSTAGGKAEPPRQITSGEYHDSMPRWSSDGHTLAFLSDRTGTPQLYLLPMQGGEVHQLSTLSQGVSEYSWRPDGSALLAHSPWRPQDEKPETDGSDTVTIYTRLDAWHDGAGHNQGRHQQLWLISLEGAVQRLTSEPVDLEQSCWSPDGTEIVFCANRRPDPDLSVSRALWVLTVSTGQLRRLTPEEGLAQVPCWSPDGQSIAYLYAPDQSEAGNLSPWLVQAQGDVIPHPIVDGAEELNCQVWVIDEQRTEWLLPPQWYPDGKSLLVAVQERGQVHLHRIDIEQQQIVALTSGNGRYVSPQISQDGQMITMVRADWFTPGDIWSMDSAGKGQRKLTKANDAFLQRHQLIRPRRISWQSFDGLTIEGWLYLPTLAEHAKAPLILAPHGGPSLAWGDGYVHEFQVLAGRGYAVLAPNPRGSSGYGEEFSRKVLNDWGGADFQDIMAGVDHVIATEPIDADRLGIGGMSYGGYMTMWAITQTNRFKAAVSRNGVSSIASASLLSDQMIWFQLSIDNEALRCNRSALTFADHITTPLLLLHAEDDSRCPFSESMQLFIALRQRKHLVELVGYPHASHLMDWPQVGTPQQRVDRLRRTVEWFEHFV